jgi:hypothetical protein
MKWLTDLEKSLANRIIRTFFKSHSTPKTPKPINIVTKNKGANMSNITAEQKTADWMTTKWRPLMAVTYMATIWFDFIAGPILYNLLQYWNPGQAISAYQPITLQGGGLYHISMGAILGIAAWTRGQEKVAAINNPPPEPVMNLPVASAPIPMAATAPVASAPVIASAPTTDTSFKPAPPPKPVF